TPAGADDQLVGSDGRLLWPHEKCLPRERPLASGLAAQDNLGVVGGEHRQGITRWRGRTQVATDGAAIADLGRANRARGLHQWLEGRHLPDDGGVGYARAQVDL